MLDDYPWIGSRMTLNLLVADVVKRAHVMRRQAERIAALMQERENPSQLWYGDADGVVLPLDCGFEAGGRRPDGGIIIQSNCNERHHALAWDADHFHIRDWSVEVPWRLFRYGDHRDDGYHLTLERERIGGEAGGWKISALPPLRSFLPVLLEIILREHDDG